MGRLLSAGVVLAACEGLTVRSRPDGRLPRSEGGRGFKKVVEHLRAGLRGDAVLRYLREEGVEAGSVVGELRGVGVEELGS